MDFDPDNIQKVKLDSVQPNNYNPKLKDTPEYQKVVASIVRNGLKMPIFVRETEDGLVIVDGEQRWTAAKELGYDEIYVYNLGNISEEEAKALTIWFEVQVPFDDVQLAPIIVELNAIDIELPFSDEQILDYIALADFDFTPKEENTIETSGDSDDGLCKLIVRMVESQYNMVQESIEKIAKNENVSEGTALTLLVCGEKLLDE